MERAYREDGEEGGRVLVPLLLFPPPFTPSLHYLILGFVGVSRHFGLQPFRDTSSQQAHLLSLVQFPEEEIFVGVREHDNHQPPTI
jgi:hypothetical protein